MHYSPIGSLSELPEIGSPVRVILTDNTQETPVTGFLESDRLPVAPAASANALLLVQLSGSEGSYAYSLQLSNPAGDLSLAIGDRTYPLGELKELDSSLAALLSFVDGPTPIMEKISAFIEKQRGVDYLSAIQISAAQYAEVPNGRFSVTAAEVNGPLVYITDEDSFIEPVTEGA